MNAALNDLILQTVLVGFVLNGAAATVALYLWTDNRSERWLLLMGISKSIGATRWLLHYVAEMNATWRLVEGMCSQMTMFFALLACYSLSSYRPWEGRRFASVVGLLLVSYTLAAGRLDRVLEASYLMFAVTLMFCSTVMWKSFRQTRLSGYAILAFFYLYQCVVVSVGLGAFGRAIGNVVAVPLVYHVGVMLGFIITFYQRSQRRLTESEATLDRIFEVAPTALTIVEPVRGTIERANPSAQALFGRTEAELRGRTAAEAGLLKDHATRTQIYVDLEAGRRLDECELRILRPDQDERIVAVSAAPVALRHGRHHVFSFYDLTAQRRVEDQLRASAAQIEALYQRLASVEDEERRQLHRELHDQVGANLSALLLELDLLARLDDRNAAARHLASAREINKETIGMARDLMAQLRPPALDDYGMVAALRDYAETQRQRFGVDLQVEGADLVPRLSSVVEVALFRIAQEAVVNALKHASAAHVKIEVSERDGVVILNIEDDGAGFDPALPAVGRHWGLRNMQERARGVRGHCEITAARGQGTRVCVQVRREVAAADRNENLPA